MLTAYRRDLLLGTASIAFAPPGVESGVSRDATTSITLDSRGTGTKAVTTEDRGVSREPVLDADEEDADAEDPGDGDGDDGGDPADTGDPDGDPDDAGKPVADLGDYSDERHDEFDARYRTADGNLNEAALTAEFDQNAASGKAGLNEGTYAYFEALGIPKSIVKSVEAGQVALREKGDTALISIAGSRESLDAAVAWAKKSYTPTQRQRFNAVMNGSDSDAKAEAIEALVSRHQKATGGRRLGKRTTPLASATEKRSGGSTSSAGFASRDEWLEARTAAKGDARKEAAVLGRLRASNRRNW